MTIRREFETMGWHSGWMNGMGGFMFPGLGLIIIVILVIVVFWAIGGGRAGRGPNSVSSGQRDRLETPLEILKRRYASGEITKEEYDQMKRDLES